VPSQHLAQVDLPAVSGSSGRLVLCHRAPSETERIWPGKVFAQEELSYEEGMAAYVAATRDRLKSAHVPRGSAAKTEPSIWQKDHKRLGEWLDIRQRRQQENQVWHKAKTNQSQAVKIHAALSFAERKRKRADWESKLTSWKEIRQQRLQCLEKRKIETAAWHERNRLSPRVDLTGCAFPWIAILVVTDNCTRQCLGLPLFQSGAHLTSQEVVEALAQCLPEDLAFLISDQDFRFRSQVFTQLAQAHDFVHVPVYRHRPRSNGIAEHFVWTLKDWLEPFAWDTPPQLAQLLTRFSAEYNDRPHQGLPFPGLSPNEFANRIFLF
jgi:hypothetical protein